MHLARVLLAVAVFGFAPCIASSSRVAAQRPASDSSASASASAPNPASPPRRIDLTNKPWRGDFDAMLERRVIRVLVPFSRTLYFNDRGHERGLTADFVRDFERYVNKTYADRLGGRPITVFMIPTTRDRLLPRLSNSGRRYRRRQPDRHRRASETGRLRHGARSQANARAGSDRAEVAGIVEARRSKRKNRSRAPLQ